MQSKWACIFDFDGVIADSIPALYQIYLDFLAERGVEGTQEEFNRLNGPNLREISTYLKAQYAWQETVEEIEQAYLAALKHLYEKAQVHTGAKSCLATLATQGVPILLASACNRHDIEGFLQKHQLDAFFSAIISGDEVKQAKPHPDIYLKARAKVPAHHCLVIEDSLNGLKAAQAAGLATVHYAPDASDTYPASFHNQQLESIPDLLQNACKGAFSFSDQIASSTPTLNIQSVVPEWTVEDERQVQALWSQKPSTVFDDKVLCLTGQRQETSQTIFDVITVPYRYIYAQCQGLSLSHRLYPLAVSGVVIDEQQNVLYAVRDEVTQYAGYRELVPSGGMSAVQTDPLSQLLTEFEEETGLASTQVTKTHYLGLFLDPLSSVFDFAYQLSVTDLTELDIRALSSEYRHYAFASISELQDGMRREKHPWVPTSQALLQYLMP